ncbi:uncharacterized protein LOC144470335 [Augochlora pura]
MTERNRTLRSKRTTGNDEPISISKQLTRAGSESKTPSTPVRPTRKTRASSMEPTANIEKNHLKTSKNELVHTPANTRKRRSILSTKKPISEEKEEKIVPIIELEHVVPNLKEINEASSESIITEDTNKSMPASKNLVDTVSEGTCKEETDADMNARKENAISVENSPMKAIEEVKMDMPINKLIASDNSERSLNDTINSTQVETLIEGVSKIQPQISSEVTPRKLGLKTASYANKTIEEEDELLDNKENQEANIIENSKNTDVAVSTVLLQSPKLAKNNISLDKSVKESDENADSTDNTRNVMVTDTDSLSEIQILKNTENVNDKKTLSPCSNSEDQNTSSADMQVESSKDEEIDTEKSLRLRNITEGQLQNTTSKNETINKNKNVETPLTSNISKNLADTDLIKCSNLSDASIVKASTTLILPTKGSTKDDSPSLENEGKESSDVDTKLTDFEANSVARNEDNIINETEGFSDAQSPAKQDDKVLETNDKTQNSLKLDDSLMFEKESEIDSNTQSKIEENEISLIFDRQDEKSVDDDHPDENVSTDLFQDIPAEEWKEKISDITSVHSMSTERLENESENECDDFVLVDKEASQTSESTNNEKEKKSLNYDSDDTVLLKTKKDDLKGKRGGTTSPEVQCEMSENKLAAVINRRKSMQQEEINERKSVRNDLEVESENGKESTQNQDKDIQNVSITKSTAIKISNKYTPASNTLIEDSVDSNLTTETDQNLNMSSTESPFNKRNSKSKLYKSVWSTPKPVKKLNDEIEKFSEADTVEEIESLNKSPIGSPSSTSDTSKLNESIDSDIEREYNLHGVELMVFSDDDVPGDECRASETESSDPDDHGSDLADFVVNDDDMSEEEIEPSEIDEELYSPEDDDEEKSNEDTIDKQCSKIQVEEENEEEEIEKEKQKETDTDTLRKDKRKSTKSKKLSLAKNKDNDRKITKSEIESSKKKKRKNKIESSDDEVYKGNEEKIERNRKLRNRNIVNANETGKTKQEVQVQESKGKVTKKKQGKVVTDKKVEVIRNKFVDTAEEGCSKFDEAIQLNLSKNGKNVKRKAEAEIVSKKIKKNKVKNDDDEQIQKENAIQNYKNQNAKCSMVESPRKGIKRLSSDVIGSLSDIRMNVLKKSKPNEPNLPSRSNPYSLLKTSKLNAELDLIFLSSYGSTSNFYVENLQRLKRTKTSREIQLFRQRILDKKARIANKTFFLHKQNKLY